MLRVFLLCLNQLFIYLEDNLNHRAPRYVQLILSTISGTMCWLWICNTLCQRETPIERRQCKYQPTCNIRNQERIFWSLQLVPLNRPPLDAHRQSIASTRKPVTASGSWFVSIFFLRSRVVLWNYATYAVCVVYAPNPWVGQDQVRHWHMELPVVLLCAGFKIPWRP